MLVTIPRLAAMLTCTPCRLTQCPLISLQSFGFKQRSAPVPSSSFVLGTLQHFSRPMEMHIPIERGARLTAAAGPQMAEVGPSFKLIIYSKEDCHLCDGLKEKLAALLERASFVPSVLSGVELEVRDISGNSTWEAAYSMSVPVLARADLDGSNEVI
jgi:hypothetical protein